MSSYQQRASYLSSGNLSGFDQINYTQGHQINVSRVGSTADDRLDTSISTIGVNDLIFGMDGNDIILSGLGNDHVYGGLGRDSINGGEGSDFVYGNDGDDNIIGGDGNDHIFGGEGDDFLVGGLGDDKIVGGTGNDIITTEGSGSDILEGGTGADEFWISVGSDVIIKDLDDSDSVFWNGYKLSSFNYVIVDAEAYPYWDGVTPKDVMVSFQTVSTEGMMADLVWDGSLVPKASDGTRIEIHDFVNGNGGIHVEESLGWSYGEQDGEIIDFASSSPIIGSLFDELFVTRYIDTSMWLNPSSAGSLGFPELYIV